MSGVVKARHGQQDKSKSSRYDIFFKNNNSHYVSGPCVDDEERQTKQLASLWKKERVSESEETVSRSAESFGECRAAMVNKDEELVQNKEGKQLSSYRVGLLFRSFLYALVLSIFISSIVLSQLFAVKSKDQISLQVDVNYEERKNNGHPVAISSSHPHTKNEEVNSSNPFTARLFHDQPNLQETILQKIKNIFSFQSVFQGKMPKAGGDGTGEKVSSTSSSSRDTCAGQWDSQLLNGRCYGLKVHSQFSELKKIRRVKTAAACQDLCCRLGRTCQTWQFWVDLQVCKLGGYISQDRIVSNVNEKVESGPWCESLPPVTWRGGRVQSRNISGVVQWSSEILDSHCFGLQSVDKRDDLSCQQACAQDLSCLAWQFHKERGCFHGSDLSVIVCEPYRGRFEGARKKFNNESTH